jgi:glycosyltransferase involved in cell wall biosynthesis
MVVTPGGAASDSITAMGVSPRRITEGFNAVDVQAFHAASLAACELDQQEAPGHHYLYVGQLIARKRVDRIVDAFEEIASSRDRLTIIGAGDREEVLTGQVSRVRHRISILPIVENRELPGIMAQHHTLVLASSTEVWGLVVNEALASGMHAVVSSNCGVAASVGHMKGIFLAATDLSDLATMMKESRQSWNGRIQDPQILEHTPAEFAERFGAAFTKAHSRRQRAPKARRLTA